jgi:hypothetical protein
MSNKTFKGTVGTDFEGNKIDEIPFEYSAEQYESYHQVPAGDRLTDADCLKVVNNSLKAAARATETVRVLQNAGYQRPDRNSAEFVRANMVKMLMKLHNIDEKTAETILAGAEQAAKAIA